MENDDRLAPDGRREVPDGRQGVDERVVVRPAAGAPQGAPPGDDRGERARRDPGAVRADDTEPYVALQYVARLFKIVAMVVIVALTTEVVMGVMLDGADALLPLIAEVVRGGVLAAILWGASDLTLLFIDVGHDVRAQRVLLGRLTARQGPEVRRGPFDEER